MTNINEILIFDGYFTWDMIKDVVEIGKRYKNIKYSVSPILISRLSAHFPNLQFNLMLDHPYAQHEIDELILLGDRYGKKYTQVTGLNYSPPLLPLIEEDWKSVRESLSKFGAFCKGRFESRLIIQPGFLAEEEHAIRLAEFAEQAEITNVVIEAPVGNFNDFILLAHETKKNCSIPVGILVDCESENDLQTFINATFPIKIISSNNVIDLA